MDAMRASPCLNLQLSDAQRVALLLEDYVYLTQDVAYFCERLAKLIELKGHEVVGRWQQLAQKGDFSTVVMELLTQHYDPAYLQSMQRNFARFAEAGQLTPSDRSTEAMTALAAHMLVRQPSS
jgi:tRNA 2-selenouridine synthase